MSLFDRIEIVCGDIRDVAADFIILKYADRMYGAEGIVAGSIGVDIHVPENQMQTYPGHNIAAKQVAFVGVGDLFSFRYAEIEAFALDSLLKLTRDHPETRSIAATIHGPGYGLDEREAFLSQVRGFDLEALTQRSPIEKIIIAEKSEERAARLQQIIDSDQSDLDSHDPPDIPPQNSFSSAQRVAVDDPFLFDMKVDDDIDDLLGRATPFIPSQPVGPDDPFINAPAAAPLSVPKEKPKLFAAMPFAEKYMDAYDLAFVDAAHNNGFICERLDRENYVGDITDEIFKRIRDSCGVIALLNENNPNVFLETGYAMALGKPVILVAHKDQDIAFDLRGQKRLTYSRLHPLRHDMTALVAALKADGTLT